MKFCCAQKHDEAVVVVDARASLQSEHDVNAMQTTTSTFKAVLQRDSSDAPWGLKVDFSDNRVMHVCELRSMPSPVSIHNACSPEAEQIRAGDYILVVNQVSAATAVAQNPEVVVADALREEMKSLRVDLLVARPVIFEQSVQRNGESLGLEVSVTNVGSSLVVMAICKGAVQRCAADVRVGDRVVGVDDASGTPDVLLDAIRANKDPIVLKISRPGQ